MKTKKNGLDWNKLKIFILSIGIIFLIAGLYAFFTGYHNVDLSTNVLRISYENNLNPNSFYDIYSLKDTIGINNLYIIGMNQMKFSLIYIFISGIIIGVSFFLIYRK